MKPTSVTLQRIVSGATAVRLPGDWRMASARTIVAGVDLRHEERDQRIARQAAPVDHQLVGMQAAGRRRAVNVRHRRPLGERDRRRLQLERVMDDVGRESAGIVGVVEEDVALGEVVARPRGGAGGDQVEVVVDLGDQALVQAAHQAHDALQLPVVRRR